MPVERAAPWAVALLGVVALGGLMSMHGLQATTVPSSASHHVEHPHDDDCVGCDHLGHIAGVCLAVIVAAAALRRVAAKRGDVPTSAPAAPEVMSARGFRERPTGLPPPRIANCVWVC